MKTLYTAEVTATGGRTGHVRSSDGVLDIAVALPEGLGGKKGSSNPEQLFAAGYASCFQSAMLVVAGRKHVHLDPTSTVTAHVDLNQLENGAYGLGVKLDIDLKDFDKEEGRKLVEEAHRICPYSIGTRGNIDVQLNVL